MRALTAAELNRALGAAVGAAADELRRSRPALGGRLAPMLLELAKAPSA